VEALPEQGMQKWVTGSIWNFLRT